MILLFKTTNKVINGLTKGLKIDTTKKEYKCGYYTLTYSELFEAIQIKVKDYKKIILQLKEANYQKTVINN